MVSEPVTKSKPVKELKIVSRGHGCFEVNAYRVDTINHTCTCKAWYYNKKPDEFGNKTCKHIKFAKMFEFADEKLEDIEEGEVNGQDNV